MLAEILADSINGVTGDRITTFLLPRFPYVLLQEPATHRLLYGSHSDEPLITESLRKFDRDSSTNGGSTRAIPIKRVIEAIRSDPYIPAWTRNQKGMVGLDDFTVYEKARFDSGWLEDMEYAIAKSEERYEQGISKQDANRLLIPFLRIPVIVTATDYDNFFRLRTAPDVQPDFRAVALEMQRLYERSRPQLLYPSEWHIPLLRSEDRARLSLWRCIQVSAARHARGSLANHLGEFDYEADYDLHDRLIAERHASPLEHQAKCLDMPAKCRNFSGWMSYRAHIEDGVPIE